MRTRCSSAALLLLCCPAAQLHAQGDPVAHLRSLAESCAADVHSCNPDAVGSDVHMGTVGNGGYVLHLDWMRTAFHDASADNSKRSAAMIAVSAQLDALTRTTPAAQHEGNDESAVKSVLARDEFSVIQQPSLWQRLMAKLFSYLYRLIEGANSMGASHPWLGTLLEWLLFIGAAVGLVVLIIRNARMNRLTVAAHGAEHELARWERESIAWAQLAEERARERAWRDAIHCLFWASVVQLEGERAFRRDASRTPREYVRLLEPESSRRSGLATLVRLLERTWYGLREATESEYGEAQIAYSTLKGARR